jgi:hypothetical protein
MPHLSENALGDIVVAAPVRRAFRILELVEIMAAGRCREFLRGHVDRPGVFHLMDLPPIEADRFQLGKRRGRRHHGDERKAQHPREVGL